ncbi:type II toxin-antitoxin system VapC family toxin [Halopiger goleimassiliensis]|uniref:type II toxin-antitoxin system VapC family toxin n=1 Tax=Halopiger goleimassiliensis TaxID=1293048 RepID=UPI0006776B95|nr:PIN domain-containing protein [Halopiger goleimassiliensis]
MPRAVVDTSVLFAASYRRDGAHEDALPILHGIDDQSLPEAIVLEYVLAETLNGLTTHAGHDPAVDFLDRVEENARFHVVSLSTDTLATAKSEFRRYEALSFVDACIVAYMHSNGVEYLYAFDDDFDRVDEVSRLETPTNPYDPR